MKETYYEFEKELMDRLEQLLGYTPENIHQKIEEQLAQLAAMPDEDRTAFLRRTMYPMPLDFTKEIDGTTYTVNAVFDKQSDMSIKDKVEIYIGKQQES